MLSIDNDFEVVIVGGGTAGLSAALVLGRARRRTLILDQGSPRNAPATASHGFLTQDGTPPLELLKLARAQLAPYPVFTREGAANTITRDAKSFALTLETGETVRARRVLLATGVVDLLPDLPGLREGWGKTVLHCPYCHGWEVRDRRLADLIPGGGHTAYHRGILLRQWTPHLVLLTQGPHNLTSEQYTNLTRKGVQIEERPITEWQDGQVKFQDGTYLERDVLFVVPGQAQRSTLPDQLACERSESGPLAGVTLKVTPESGLTSVPGAYAAGDIVGEQQVVLAAASGARAAAAINMSLCIEAADQG